MIYSTDRTPEQISGTAPLWHLHRQPLSVQMAAILILITAVGAGCMFVSFRGYCVPTDLPICIITIVMTLLFTLFSLYLLPEIALAAMLAGIIHLLKVKRFDGSVVGSILIASFVLGFDLWLNLRPFTDLARHMVGLIR